MDIVHMFGDRIELWTAREQSDFCELGARRLDHMLGVESPLQLHRKQRRGLNAPTDICPLVIGSIKCRSSGLDATAARFHRTTLFRIAFWTHRWCRAALHARSARDLAEPSQPKSTPALQLQRRLPPPLAL